jgi:hypothetical protein
MSDFGKLEEQAALTLDQALLSVYADALLERGDVRGEILALEIAAARDGVVDGRMNRREALVNQWIGDRRPGGRIVAGFLEIDAFGIDAADEIRRWMGPTTAPYVRSIMIAGDRRSILTSIELMSERVWPVLCHLGLRKTRIVDEDPLQPIPGTPPIEEAQLDGLLEMTPRLVAVEFNGTGILRRFSHPYVCRVSLTGYRGTRLGELPNLTSLDLAIHHQMDAPNPTTPPISLLTNGLLDPKCMPGLTHLDLSRNGPGIREPFDLGGAVNMVRFVSHLPVLSQLRSLRLPPFRSPADAGQLQMVLNRMPELEVLELVRVPHDQRSLVSDLKHSKARILASDG